jgi:hypothetical protein
MVVVPFATSCFGGYAFKVVWKGVEVGAGVARHRG